MMKAALGSFSAKKGAKGQKGSFFYMYQDMYGVKRMKINLHQHTTCSDGRLSPEEAAARYQAAGYDMVALTDHWYFRQSGEINGLRILGGAEYDFGGDGATGVYHILGLGCQRAPELKKGVGPQALLDGINACGGLAVLAHPAWSLNTAAQAAALCGVGATEIYNTVSDAHESARPYSGDFVDTAAGQGMIFPLLASDDTHYYDGTDDTCCAIMLDCPLDAPDAEVLNAIRQQKFYATQGPEIHLERVGNEAVVHCSPACRINFFSNAVWGRGHGHAGEGLTEARCTLMPFETFIRAEVTDEKGRKAWSNILRLKEA